MSSNLEKIEEILTAAGLPSTKEIVMGNYTESQVEEMLLKFDTASLTRTLTDLHQDFESYAVGILVELGLTNDDARRIIRAFVKRQGEKS